MNYSNHCNPKCIVYEKIPFRADPEPEGWLRIVFQSLDDIIKSPVQTGKSHDERCTISQCDINGDDLRILTDYLDNHAVHKDTVEEAIIDCFYNWGESEDWFQFEKFESVCEELGIHPGFGSIVNIWVVPRNEEDISTLRNILADNHIRYIDGEYAPNFQPYVNGYFPLELNLMERTAREFVSNITCLAARSTFAQTLHVEELSHFRLRA